MLHASWPAVSARPGLDVDMMMAALDVETKIVMMLHSLNNTFEYQKQKDHNFHSKSII